MCVNLTFLDPLDLDGTLGNHGRQRADRGQHRRNQGADDSDRQRKLGNDLAFLPDPDAPDVTGFNQVLDGLEKLIAGGFNRLPEGLFHIRSRRAEFRPGSGIPSAEAPNCRERVNGVRNGHVPPVPVIDARWRELKADVEHRQDRTADERPPREENTRRPMIRKQPAAGELHDTDCPAGENQRNREPVINPELREQRRQPQRAKHRFGDETEGDEADAERSKRHLQLVSCELVNG